MGTSGASSLTIQKCREYAFSKSSYATLPNGNVLTLASNCALNSNEQQSCIQSCQNSQNNRNSRNNYNNGRRLQSNYNNNVQSSGCSNQCPMCSSACTARRGVWDYTASTCSVYLIANGVTLVVDNGVPVTKSQAGLCVKSNPEINYAFLTKASGPLLSYVSFRLSCSPLPRRACTRTRARTRSVSTMRYNATCHIQRTGPVPRHKRTD